MHRTLNVMALVALLAPVALAAGNAKEKPVSLNLEEVPLATAVQVVLKSAGRDLETGGALESQAPVTLRVRQVSADAVLKVLTSAQDPGAPAPSLEEMAGFDRLIVDGRNLLSEAWNLEEYRLEGLDELTLDYVRHRRLLAEQKAVGGSGFIGVELAGKTYPLPETFPPLVRETFEAWDGWGAFLRNVLPGSPATESGLQPGDIVIRLDGYWVDSTCTLQRLVSRARIGKTVEVEVLRDGQVALEWVTVGTRPQQAVARP